MKLNKNNLSLNDQNDTCMNILLYIDQLCWFFNNDRLIAKAKAMETV